jgi:hypothetical protein
VISLINGGSHTCMLSPKVACFHDKIWTQQLCLFADGGSKQECWSLMDRLRSLLARTAVESSCPTHVSRCQRRIWQNETCAMPVGYSIHGIGDLLKEFASRNEPVEREANRRAWGRAVVDRKPMTAHLAARCCERPAPAEEADGQTHRARGRQGTATQGTRVRRGRGQPTVSSFFSIYKSRRDTRWCSN